MKLIALTSALFPLALCLIRTETASAAPAPSPASPATSADSELVERQTSGRTTNQWSFNCFTGTQVTPSSFKSFNVGNCEAQLSFTRDEHHVGLQWNFDAVYPDGSRQRIAPIRDFYNFALSDEFYSVDLGNNFFTDNSNGRPFTSVHDFKGVCKNGVAPSAWVFSVPSNGKSCQNRGLTFATDPVTARTSTRPAQVSGLNVRRANNQALWDVSWSPTSGAAAYSALFQYPTSDNGYGDIFTNVQGKRITAPTTSITFSEAGRYASEPRKFVVHAINSDGVFSFTNLQPRSVSW